MKRELGRLLQTNQESTARIRVEHVFREQNVMAAYEIIELFCELLIVSLPIIDSQRQCPLDLREAVASLIFAAPRCADLLELQQIGSLFSMKYGKDFAAAASELRPDCGVNRLVIEKLSVRALYGEVKLKLMKDIAAEQGVDWDATASESELIKAPKDYLDGPNRFMGATQVYFQTSSKDPNSKENATVYNQGGCMEDDIQNIPLVFPDVAMALTGQSISQEPRAQKHVIDESLRASASFSEQKNVKFRYDDRDDARTEIGREERFKDAATAAHAAVQSAERAAAAARAAASLAKGSFARMPGEKSNRSTCEFSAGSEEDDHKKAATMQTGPTREYIKIQMDSFINHAKPLFDDYPEEIVGCSRTQRVPTRKQTVFKEYSSDEDQSDSTDDDQSASPPAYRASKFDDDHIAQQSINLSHRDSRKYSPKSWQSARRRSYDECTGDETGNHHYQRQPSKPKDMPSYRSGSSQPPQRPPPDPIPGQTVEKTSPHVHPKLPDYDDLSARLEALRSKR